MKSASRKFYIVFIIIVGLIFLAAYKFLPDILENGWGGKIGAPIRRESFELDTESEASVGDFLRTGEIYYTPDGPVPTNKIWSSAVFTGEIKGLYPLPFAINSNDKKLNITLPKKFVHEKLVTAQIISDFISLEAVATKFDHIEVESFSDLTVLMAFKDSQGNTLFKANFVQGSPYIFIQPVASEFQLSSGSHQLSQKSDHWVYTHESGDLAVVSNGEGRVENDNLKLNFKQPETGFITIAAYDTDKKVVEYASNIIETGETQFKIEDDQIVVEYQFDYKSGIQEKTLFGLLPHHYKNGGFNVSKAIFTKNTIRGDQHFIETEAQLRLKLDRQPMLEQLPIPELTDSEKDQLGDMIEEDLRRVVFLRNSVYFGGNDLLKLARLMQIADEIGRDDLVENIRGRLVEEFEDWFSYEDTETSKYFVYDDTIRGLIGFETTGFGGENFNDHHFQYGYMIHTAAILGQYDEEFVRIYGGFVNQLVKDIANPIREDSNFPYLRNFDSYEGHSWATGFADFTDGNNQESTSEAINAWYGVWLWARLTEEEELEEYAEYLYSSEVNSTRHYWLNWYNNRSIFPEGYDYSKTSTLWGGKFEYQTFFSTEPQSIEGIQYLPFSPGTLYLYNRSTIIRDYDKFEKHIENFNAHLIDLNYMYYTMVDGFNLLTEDLIETMQIDQGMSRSNMYHWAHFWDEISDIKPVYSSKNPPAYFISYESDEERILVSCKESSFYVSPAEYQNSSVCN